MKKFSTIDEINAAAQGNWPAVLEAAGVPRELLNTHKHQPCPACGGTDRYRFTDHKGGGVWICNQCQPEGGSPLDLLMAAFGYSLHEAKDVLADVLGLAHGDTERREPKPLPPPARKKDDEREKWQPILPVPEFALKSMHFTHGWRKPEDMLFASVFRDAVGQVLGAVVRFKKSDGGKIDMPYTFCRHVDTGVQKWCWRGWEAPRPLYGLDALAANPESPVLIVEGEKCKNAADAAKLPFAVATWHGGCNNWDKADWQPIANRRVVLWPDCDSERERLSKAERDAGAAPDSKPYKPREKQGGWLAMQGIAARLAAQGCEVYTVAVPAPGVWPHGYDIADALADGGRLVDPAAVLSWQHRADWLIEYRPIEDDGTESLRDIEDNPPPAPKWLDGADDMPPPENPEQADGGDAGGWQEALQWVLENIVRLDGRERFFCLPVAAEWGKRELIGRLGQKGYQAFLSHPNIIDWPKAKADLLAERKKAEVILEDPIFKEDFSRFVLVYGENDVVDLQKMGYRGDNGLMKVSNLKPAIGKDRADVWVDSDSPRKLKVLRPDYGFFPFEPFGVSRLEDGAIDCDQEGFVKMINTYNGLPFVPSETADFSALRKKTLAQLCFEFEGCRNIIACLNSLCNDDERVFEWVINWMACRVRYPTSKQATALVLASPVQGAGKSLIFSKLMCRIFGRYGNTLNQTAMESTFTGDYDEKMYICYEEVSSQKARFDLAGRIKDQITSENIRIERKGRDAVYQKNFIGFVYLSNYRSPVVIEEHDRRFFVVAPEKALDKPFAARVAEEIYNDLAVQEFVDLLWALPLTYTDESGDVQEFGAHTPTFDTVAKLQMKEWNSSTTENFMKEWQNGSLRLPVIHCYFDDLYDAFCAWAYKGNEKKLPKSKFRQVLNGYDGFEVKRTNDSMGRKIEFVIPPENSFAPMGVKVPDEKMTSKALYYTNCAEIFHTRQMADS